MQFYNLKFSEILASKKKIGTTNIVENLSKETFEEYESTSNSVGYDYDYELNDFRIVNGYEPHRRPWMVLMVIYGAEICGGALLNQL